MNEAEHRELWTLFGDILSRETYDRLDEVYAADIVVEFPQSGERFRGVESLRGQFAKYPTPQPLETKVADVIGGTTYALTPRYTVVAVEGSGDRGTAIFRTRYPDGTWWWNLNVYEAKGGRLVHVRTFFAQEFEPPAWREPFWDKT